MLVISHNYPIKVYNKSAYILKYDAKKKKNSTVRGESFIFHYVPSTYKKIIIDIIVCNILKNIIHLLMG